MVIPTPEIIQPRFFIVDIATVAERLHSAQRSRHVACLADGAAPGIIHILNNNGTGAVKQCHNIALQILDIVVRHTIVHNHSRLILRIVEEMQFIVALGHVHHILTMQSIISHDAIDRFLNS